MASFRCHARNFFLTYAQCPEDPNDLLLFILESFPSVIIARTCRENHSSGELHLHAYLRFEGKHDCRHAQEFDFKGHHPNISAARNPKKALNYCAKDGDYYDFSEDGHTLSDGIDGVPEPADFESEGEFLRACLSESVPYGYAQQFWRLYARPDKHFRLDSYPGIIVDANLNLRAPSPSTTTVVIGPSGCGKTTWAVTHAPKPTLIASHIDDLKFINSDTQSIVFDDMDFAHWPRTAQIHLVDQDLPRSVNVRYGTVNIPARITKIFTANVYPFSRMEPAIDRRITLIDLY